MSKFASGFNLHVKTPALLIIIDFYHTNITLAVLIGQMLYSYTFKEIGNKISLKTKYIRRCYCERIMHMRKNIKNMRDNADFNLFVFF